MHCKNLKGASASFFFVARILVCDIYGRISVLPRLLNLAINGEIK